MDASAADGTPRDDSAWDYPDYPPGSVVEMRVHGVGGEPPSGMTRDPNPQVVGGSALAGFWRARNPVVGTLPDGRLHVREVLAWGGHTSGTVRHAFWVLLLPFALFNVAGRMHHPAGRHAHAYRSACRMLAYTMTLAWVALVTGITVDLLGVQCGASAPCRDGTADITGAAILAPLRHDPDGHLQRLALLVAVALAAILLLWWASRYKRPSLDTRPPTNPGDREAIFLDDQRFWHTAWPASRLRSVHVSGAMAYLGAVMGFVHLDIGRADLHGLWHAMVVSAVVVMVAGIVLVALPSTAATGPAPAVQQALWMMRLGAIVPLATTLTTPLGPWQAPTWLVVPGVAAVLVWMAWQAHRATRPSPSTSVAHNLLVTGGTVLAAMAIGPTAGGTTPQPGMVPDALTWITGTNAQKAVEAFANGVYVPAYLLLLPIAILQVAFLVVILAYGASRTVPTRPQAAPIEGRVVPGNLGGVAVGLVSLLLLTATGGSVHALVLEWIGDRASLTLPWWYALTALVVAFGLPAVLAITWLAHRAVVTWSGRYARSTASDVASELERGLDPGVPDPTLNDQQRPKAERDALRRVSRGWLTHLPFRAAGWALLTTTLALTAGVITVLGRHWPRTETISTLAGVTAASWVMVGLAVGAGALIRSGLSDRATRRHVGRVWDVVTFWPRVTHPLAPPCYGDAIVPMLQERVDLLTARGHQVVLAGHSQGSVIALAAACSASWRLDRVAMVSYGSPIAILYEPFFPAVFGGDDGAIARGGDRIASWHHLFSLTEPFAGPFWDHDSFAVVDRRRAQAGWGLSRLVSHPDAPCPVCGWSRAGIAALPPQPPARTDHVVTDPQPWRPATGTDIARPLGHSCYHRHREVDAHLAAIATSLPRPG